MSDNARQSFTDKAEAAIKPDSQKTGTEQFKDTVKGKGDSTASTMQPQSEKSTAQKAGDAISGNSNQSDESMMDKAKHAVGMGKH